MGGLIKWYSPLLNGKTKCPSRQIHIYANIMYHLLKIYFKLCPNDSHFNSGEKIKKQTFSGKFLKRNPFTIRFISKIIRNLEAAFPVIKVGPFHYRVLETDKVKTLKQSSGNYDASDYVMKQKKNNV